MLGIPCIPVDLEKIISPIVIYYYYDIADCSFK